MQLHTRVIVVGRTVAGSTQTKNFGIPYQPDRGLARQNEKVVTEVKWMEARYPFVSVTFEDAS